MSSYSDLLRDPRWQKKRLYIFERDKFSCTNCHNGSIELQIHHLDYLPGIKPWDYPDDMLKTLCRVCHVGEQERPKHEDYLLTSLKMNGFFAFHILKMSALIDTDINFRNQLKQILNK